MNEVSAMFTTKIKKGGVYVDATPEIMMESFENYCKANKLDIEKEKRENPDFLWMIKNV